MCSRVTRRAVLAGLGAASLAGCLGRVDDASTAAPTEDEVGTSGTVTAEGGGDAVSVPMADERLPLPMEPDELRRRSVSGGPPKDGIPSIDDPSFASATAASTDLEPGDPVFGVAIGTARKAYPQSILVHHEICNDVLDGTPVSVTYCPLTGTAIGFERGETTFGVSGRLINNNLIMYDRATETWWPQVLATAIPGPWNEDPPIRSLSEFRIVWTTWERWSQRYPDTQVLSKETGFARNYANDPYGSYNPRAGYYAPDSRPMFRALSDDDRLSPKRVVIGTRQQEGAVAFEKDRLRDEKIVYGSLDGAPIVAVYDSDLDTGFVFRNPDETRYEYRDGRVVDTAGGSDADGESDATGAWHDPAALPGERLLALDAMWFAWIGFYPDTTLYA
ncbi:DUF3179 domain-containing protein [Halobellus captivus]|uniref:DUF3179 domain-containing protein n=1 Tax=Halobellus captivus TaxID=2592614 RepID=UPI0011A85A17|nr:DUF3179 domain-containing protein [Halobellus captivus]